MISVFYLLQTIPTQAVARCLWETEGDPQGGGWRCWCTRLHRLRWFAAVEGGVVRSFARVARSRRTPHIPAEADMSMGGVQSMGDPQGAEPPPGDLVR